MRSLGVHLCSALLLTSLVAGCDQAGGDQEPEVPAAFESSSTPHLVKADYRRMVAPKELEARRPDPFKDSARSIVVRAKYYHTRECIHEADGSSALYMGDGFEVIEVVRGRLKATNIQVPTFSGRSPAYPKDLVVDRILTLRLNPSDETLKQMKENERKDFPFLFISGEEVEQIPTP